MSDLAATIRAMVYITHVRFGGDGVSAEDVIMLRWRESLGDTNVADMIEWIESGGIAKVKDTTTEHVITVVRDAGRAYLSTTARLAELPRF